MLIIAVTGGIGSGKSTAVDLFRKHDVPVIDTDLIARELVEPGTEALDSVTNVFGKEILNQDGSLNRHKLRDRVFSDNLQRHRLEAILHPLIHQRVLQNLAHFKAPYCLLVIPLLAESKQDYPYDRVLLVNAKKQTRINRVVSRDNIDEQAVLTIINTQASEEKRLALADDVIDNSGSMEDLKNQVDLLHEKYMALAAKNSP